MGVSERTIYRDVQALSSAGIPVYGIGGPDGGFELVESYRTSLTGLSDGERRALLLLGVPDALVKLGVGQELKAALLKLSAALPASGRADEQRVRQRFFLAPSDAGHAPAGTMPLNIVYQAVWQDRRVWVRYRAGPIAALERTVEPYALALDEGEWRLIYARHESLRVLRVASLLEARLEAETFTRRADFDLEAFWNSWRAQTAQRRASFCVRVRIAPEAEPELVLRLDAGAAGRAPVEDVAGCERGTVAQLYFESFEEARSQLLGFGCAVEVLDPPALRRSIADVAAHVCEMYNPPVPNEAGRP